MFFGKISEKNRMRMVMMADTRPNHWLPNSWVACCPTPAAPMVLAMVLSDRIAARGRSGSCFIFRKSAAWASPSSCRIVMYEMGVESKVDSRREQRKDTAIAPRRKVRRSAILYRRIRPTVQVGNWGPYPSWKTGCGENFP